MLTPAPSSSALRTSSSNQAMSSQRPLRLLRTAAQSPEEIECVLLDFNPDDDVLAIIPMPPAIAPDVRAEITSAIAARFEFSDTLDAWLHAPNPVLGGVTPYERVVDGDGEAVLRALATAGEVTEPRASLRTSAQAAESNLRLVR